MNGIQVSVIRIGIAIACLMLLVPPWKVTFSDLQGGELIERPAGLAFVLNPPEIGSNLSSNGSQIDITRLLILLAVTGAVTYSIAGLTKKG